MRNNLDGDVAKNYRMNTQFMFECVLNLCLNVFFCVGSHLAVTYSFIKRIS